MSGQIRRARSDERQRITEIRFAVQVWEEGGQILGFSAGATRDGTIWALFVDPASERRGIGRALFAAACDTLRRAGHRTAMLTTDRGTRAERFYRAAGWKVTGNSTRGELIFHSVL
jgi:GNAT superfamily N-acetyltransferase